MRLPLVVTRARRFLPSCPAIEDKPVLGGKVISTEKDERTATRVHKVTQLLYSHSAERTEVEDAGATENPSIGV